MMVAPYSLSETRTRKSLCKVCGELLKEVGYTQDEIKKLETISVQV